MKYLILATVMALSACVWLLVQIGHDREKVAQSEREAAAYAENARKLQQSITYRATEAEILRSQNTILRRHYDELNKQISEWRNQPMPSSLVDFLHHNTTDRHRDLPAR